MAVYHVTWIERLNRSASVEADTKAEAIEKAGRGEVIEGTQDSEPGKMDRRTLKIESHIFGRAPGK